ncbi:hypothetical protein BOO92_02770 [Vibrio navarrensis]|nr:hypothetical protein [Vibrio navarrensis]MBE3655627.1 hypothetical protein [Vibrio navarrensis]
MFILNSLNLWFSTLAPDNQRHIYIEIRKASSVYRQNMTNYRHSQPSVSLLVKKNKNPVFLQLQNIIPIDLEL